MTTPPPGWYDDGRGARRWWDGAHWTEFVGAQPEQEPAAQAGGPPAAAEQTPAEQTPAEQTPAGQTPAEIAPPFTPGLVPPAGIAGPYAADGYAPATYPGAVDSAPPSATAPTPRPWIVWVVIGAVVLAVVIVLAVLSPMLWAAFTAGSSPSGVASPSTSRAPTESSGSTVESRASADEQAAIEAVHRYNDAWLTGDCDEYLATTTEEFRTTIMQISDCETFQSESRLFAGQVDDYVVTIIQTEAAGSAIAVSTAETYTSRFDAEGNQTDETLEYEDRYEYIVERTEGGWAIDDFFVE